jgi:glycosyltransferase involved in cell wall biosynthesis
MNVLFIRITNRISGAEKYNFYLANELINYTDIHPLFLTDCEEFRDQLKNHGFDAYHLPIKIKEIGTKKDLLSFFVQILKYYIIYILTIIRLRRVYNFRTICFESMTEKIFLTLLFRLFLYKIVWIEHGPLYITKSTFLIKKMYLFNSILVNKIITVSMNTEKDLISGGIPKAKIITIYIGIDITDKQLQLNNTDKFSSSINFTIGFVGTLNKEKGIMRFVHIGEMLLKKDVNLKFLVVGNGPLYHQVNTYIKQKRLSNYFTLTGFVEDVSSCIKKMNAVIFPTKHNEGLSLAILEALSERKLVFAYDVGGNSELILNGETGYLFQEINKDLIDTIYSTLRNIDIQKMIYHNSVAHVSKYFNARVQSLIFEKQIQAL